MPMCKYKILYYLSVCIYVEHMTSVSYSYLFCYLILKETKTVTII